MKLDWADTLRTICPKGRPEIIAGFAGAMPTIIAQYEINTPLRLCHFLAQVCHESGSLRYVKEIWGPTPAQKRYEGRKDLGNVKKGDGKRFMGRSLIQTTGRGNYMRVSKALDVDFIENPELLEQAPYFALAAGLFWDQNNLNDLADADDVRACTKRVNGGLNGFEDRKVYLARAKKLLFKEIDESLEDLAAREVLPKKRIEELQARLTELGYPCGKIDGLMGSATVGAIAAFQHDNELLPSNRFDQATQDALYEAESRPLAPSRAEGTPDDSRIIKSASALKKGAVGTLGVVSAQAASDPISALTGVHSQFTQLKMALAPLGLAADFIKNNWVVFAILIAAAVWFYARNIEKARIEDHQTGRTL